MKEIIKNIFNKVDFKIIVGTIYLASLVFSLFPDNIINYFGLLSFKSTYQFVISLIFIVLSCYYIATLIQYVYNKIKNKTLNKKLRKMMKKISSNSVYPTEMLDPILIICLLCNKFTIALLISKVVDVSKDLVFEL